MRVTHVRPRKRRGGYLPMPPPEFIGGFSVQDRKGVPVTIRDGGYLIKEADAPKGSRTREIIEANAAAWTWSEEYRSWRCAL